MVADAADGQQFNMILGNRAQCVSAGLLGLAWQLAHHQDLLQGFLDILVHLTLKTHSNRFSSSVSKIIM